MPIRATLALLCNVRVQRIEVVTSCFLGGLLGSRPLPTIALTNTNVLCVHHGWMCPAASFWVAHWDSIRVARFWYVDPKKVCVQNG